jgi:hypothetical protein
MFWHMENQAPKTSILKKILYTLIGTVFVGSMIFSGSSDTPAPEVVQPVVQQARVSTEVKNEPIKAVEPAPIKKSTPVQKTQSLSNDDYYVNTAGNTVNSPAFADSVPAGASARCRDGTYSFSQSRRGTCSHHGGVAQWL